MCCKGKNRRRFGRSVEFGELMRLFGLRETRREKWPMGWSWLGRIRWLQNQTPGSRHLFSAHARPLALGHKRRVAALLLRAIGLLLLVLSPTYPDVSNCGGKINSYFYPGMRSLPRFLQFLFLKFKFKTIRITKSYFGRVSIFKNQERKRNGNRRGCDLVQFSSKRF